MLIENTKNIKSERSDLKKFGILFGSIFLVFGIILFFKDKSNWYYFIFAAGIFLLSAFAFPLILKPLYKVWMKFGLIMNFIMIHLVLGLLFYLVITPIGIAAKIFGKPFLDVKMDRSTKSYWILRKEQENNKKRYEKQF
ncbi:MAG: hypothetical protein KAI43_00455 [Candidatus Aureabacteria bacterium]|nr:hypothetical protein [Candidatus Auribacterota bacterium]